MDVFEANSKRIARGACGLYSHVSKELAGWRPRALTCIETIGKKQREKTAWSSALLEHRTPKGPETLKHLHGQTVPVCHETRNLNEFEAGGVQEILPLYREIEAPKSQKRGQIHQHASLIDSWPSKALIQNMDLILQRNKASKPFPSLLLKTKSFFCFYLELSMIIKCVNITSKQTLSDPLVSVKKLWSID
ncbi:hypothetical protein GOBAR_AA14716 [Gossypium barbadense]|uniref:Uncharacterized protein n=1 Tax=Gossypium barbadense TaxID=3634 RepID=A0A2P5XRH4_GOSBA|nr:hypothetical protein GOBAR_AA14716 [Gossypium barbadense]